MYGRTGRKGCCWQCTRRTVGCHSTCPDWAKEEKEIKERRAYKQQYKETRTIAHEYRMPKNFAYAKFYK